MCFTPSVETPSNSQTLKFGKCRFYFATNFHVNAAILSSQLISFQFFTLFGLSAVTLVATRLQSRLWRAKETRILLIPNWETTQFLMSAAVCVSSCRCVVWCLFPSPPSFILVRLPVALWPPVGTSSSRMNHFTGKETEPKKRV